MRCVLLLLSNDDDVEVIGCDAAVVDGGLLLLLGDDDVENNVEDIGNGDCRLQGDETAVNEERFIDGPASERTAA